MLIDNYSCPFVVTITSGTVNGIVDPGKVVGTVRNMNMGPRTPMHMWQAKVSHMVPGEWLGNWHGENRCRTLVRGYCGCSGDVEDRKQAAECFCPGY